MSDSSSSPPNAASSNAASSNAASSPAAPPSSGSRSPRPLSAGKRTVFALVPWLLGAVIVGGVWWWRQPPDNPQALGKQLNLLAWEKSFEERGLPIPGEGPREGVWGRYLDGFRPDPAGGYRHVQQSMPGFFEIDAQGRQYWRPPAPPQYRAVVLGGSVAWGAYASKIETTYFAVLGHELEAAGLPTEVVVLAASAWKSRQEIAALAADGAELNPDLIIMLGGLNDLTTGVTSQHAHGEPNPLDAQGQPQDQHAGDFDQRVTDYLTNVRRAAELAAQFEAELLVVLQPSLAERQRPTALEQQLLRGALALIGPQKALQNSYQQMRTGLQAQPERWTFLDCSQAFSAETATTFTDLWHFGDVGHGILGRQIAQPAESLLRRRPARTAD